ncbi:hypothetical protein [Bradyrhizobium genosp. P]|uniref:hypothetical protein n=1 Tax=Bradyrhizobium genosp. P TaxID=83641 RepID=UPI003CF3D9DC
MKIIRTSAPPPPKERSIMRFDPPAAPKVRPMSPAAPKQADQLDQRDPAGGIDPQQQIF